VGADMTQPRILGSRYELDSLVGRGGMADVFRAHDVRLHRTVGVKTLRSDLAHDQTLQVRFRREAQSAAALNHPSIVAIYDTGEDIANGTPVPYIVMEFVDGRTLRDLLHDYGTLPPRRAAEITVSVLTALDYSHHHGIVHRDIKPGNVIVTQSGDVKVMDFGIARNDVQLALTKTDQVLGTAQYMSPEQARGERVDARSDLYSTGCLLYELLTGRPPFTGDSPVAIAFQHVKEDPVPPSGVDPEIPAWADRVVLKALQKDPARRYQSADEMRSDIERALAGTPVVDPQRKAWPWVTLAAAIILLAAAVVGIKLLTGSDNRTGVPNVTGMSLIKAENAVTGARLRVGKVSYSSSASVAKNHVISTNPSSGTELAKGSAVGLVVSTGLTPVASDRQGRHSPAASQTPTAQPPRSRSSSGISSSATSSPPPSSPSPTPAGPSPSASCVVNILGLCV
jgi:serine/threonine protein kinase